MNLGINKKMFQKVEEKVSQRTVVMFGKLRIDMLEHVLFKKDLMEMHKKIDKLKSYKHRVSKFLR